MNKMKPIFLFIFLFIMIGFAAISVVLTTRGHTYIASDLEDFNVYFSNVLLNGEQDLSIIQNKQKLVFDFEFGELGTTQVISYDITNASKILDASLGINCTQGNEYFLVSNELDSSVLGASSTRTGTLTLKKVKAVAQQENIGYKVVCTITASPLEKTFENDVTVSKPLLLLNIGDEVTIGTEKFNVISQTEDTVTLLAKYVVSLGIEVIQTDSGYYDDAFVLTSGFSVDENNDVIFDTADGPSVFAIDNYTAYMFSLTGDRNLTVDLISRNTLNDLGCNSSCANSEYASWLVNGQRWWTKTCSNNSSGWGTSILYVDASGSTYTGLAYEMGGSMDSFNGFRPTVTISKDTLSKYL